MAADLVSRDPHYVVSLMSQILKNDKKIKMALSLALAGTTPVITKIVQKEAKGVNRQSTLQLKTGQADETASSIITPHAPLNPAMKRGATCNKLIVRFEEKERCHENLADFEIVTSSFPNGEGPRGSISNKSREKLCH